MKGFIGYDHGRVSDGSAALGALLRSRVPEIRREDAGDYVPDPLSPAKVQALRRASDRLREAECQVQRALQVGSTKAQAAAIAACRQALHHLERP